MSTGTSMKELVEYIAKNLVESPDEVSAEEIGSDNDRVIELRVAEPDRGKVIGKKGRTAHAIRALLHAASDEQRIALEILD